MAFRFGATLTRKSSPSQNTSSTRIARSLQKLFARAPLLTHRRRACFSRTHVNRRRPRDRLFQRGGLENMVWLQKWLRQNDLPPLQLIQTPGLDGQQHHLRAQPVLPSGRLLFTFFRRNASGRITSCRNAQTAPRRWRATGPGINLSAPSVLRSDATGHDDGRAASAGPYANIPPAGRSCSAVETCTNGFSCTQSGQVLPRTVQTLARTSALVAQTPGSGMRYLARTHQQPRRGGNTSRRSDSHAPVQLLAPVTGFQAMAVACAWTRGGIHIWTLPNGAYV